MEKGKDEDEMLDQTLKAVEMVNIADLATEKENLKAACDQLYGKKAELDKVEDDIHKERQREKARDNKQKKAARRWSFASFIAEGVVGLQESTQAVQPGRLLVHWMAIE